MRPRPAAILFSATAFASAFLLFQVQPMVGKAILPWFGGGAAVWTACMLFFQLVLFAGYAAAHVWVKHLPPRGQLVLHLALLALGFAFLPVLPDAAWKEHDLSRPVTHILALLTASVGPPLLVVSMTGPLLQAWFTRLRPDESPYPLYAMSNAGSLLGLITYPFLIEPTIGVQDQARLWSAGYVAFALACAAAAWWAARAPLAAATRRGPLRCPEDDATARLERPRAGDVILWVGLATCGSLLLLTVTNQLCLNIASVPFLWVLPLALYLLSFVLTFGGPRGYPRTAALTLAAPAMVLLVLAMPGKLDVPGFGTLIPTLPGHIGIHAAALFVLCVVCHGELHRLRPPTQRLTEFYLAIAGGGAVGGFLIAVVAPRVIMFHQEMQLTLLSCCFTILACLYRDRDYGLARGRPRWAWAALAAWMLLLVSFCFSSSTRMLEGVIWTARNFYGTTRVVDNGLRRLMLHGTTRHGFQDRVPERREKPTGYFALRSGVGATMRYLIESRGGARLNVGVVGLGAGTLAAYCRQGDAYRFYDIDPAVIRAADEWFSYLADARRRGCEVAIVAGDARLSLERELSSGAARAYDLLVLDAFSSDAIPVHLMTSEAFSTYRAHLAPDGILALHLTNTYLDLPRVAFALAETEGLDAMLVHIEERADWEEQSDWVLVALPGALPAGPVFADALRDLPRERRHAWTDDFSNLLSILK